MTRFVYLANWFQERRSIAKVLHPAGWAYSTHTADCARWRLKHQRRLEKWAKKWPNHCRTCGASGIVMWSENASPFGSGEYWPMNMSDVCDSCVADIDPVCPRCGTRLFGRVIRKLRGDRIETPEEAYDRWLDEQNMCLYCGWKWGSNTDDLRPYLPEECACGIDVPFGEHGVLGDFQKGVFETIAQYTWLYWLANLTQLVFRNPIRVWVGENSILQKDYWEE